MAFLGKLLVLIYGAGSLLCLMLATAIYTQKMDFVTPKDEGGKKQTSLVEKSQARTKQLLNANNRAYTRWRQEYEDMVKVESDHYVRREYYRGQLTLVRTGKYQGKDEDNPIQELGVPDDMTGLLKIDMPTGRKSIEFTATPMGKSEPLKIMSFYETGIVKASKDIEVALEEINSLIAKYAASTLVINGRETPFVKGLRKRIREQEDIEVDAIAEKIYLEDFVTNRRADAQLFVKRRDALQERVVELKKFYKIRDGAAGN